MGEFNSDSYYIYYCRQESLRRNGVPIIVNKRVPNAVLWCNLKNERMISAHFQGNPFNITVIQVYAATTNAKESEVEPFYADDTTLKAESEKLKSLLLRVKEESGKVGLKLNTQKTKIMASCPITSWQIDGETVETMADFILGGSKITAYGDFSHEIKKHLLLGRKVVTNIDSILKSRDITLPTKVHLVKAMVFPVVMYGCESWTIKKDECQRVDAFKLWCWRRLLRVPWTGKRSNQSILKEISHEYSLKGLRLKQKRQYFGHLMQRELTHLKRP